MTFLRVLTSWLVLCGLAYADTWTWEYTVGAPTPTVFFECGPTIAGPWTVLAEVPSFPASYIYTPTITTSCRVRNMAGVTNIVTRVVTSTTTDPTIARISALEATMVEIQTQLHALSVPSVSLAPYTPPSGTLPLDCYDTMLTGTMITCTPGTVVTTPPPVPTGNLTTRQIDVDHVEIVGTNCANLRTTGTGLRRIVECVH